MGTSTQENPVYYETGCSEIIKDFIDSNQIVFISVASGVIVFHAIVFAMASCNICFKNRYNRKMKKRSRIGTFNENESDFDEDDGEFNEGYEINGEFSKNERRMSRNLSKMSRNSSRISTGNRLSRPLQSKIDLTRYVT